MKRFAMIVALSLFAAKAPQALAQASSEPPRVGLKSLRAIVNADARGNEVEVLNAQFEGVMAQGGFGPFVSSWKLRMRVRVKELSYDKIFRLRESAYDGRVIQLPFDSKASDRVHWVQADRDGTGIYEIEINSPYGARPGTQYRLEIIMNPRFNQTPNLNNPVAGWYGPTYGVEFEG